VSTGAAGPGGPWFEDLEVGHVERGAPGLTLTDGHAAAHQAIAGDRLALALDAELSRDVTGNEARLAHPALVWDVAIGQSTVLTQRVVANLFYRGLTFRRMPVIGDTLRTRTEVVGLRQTSRRAGRVPRGLAALRITTLDQQGRVVLDFWRCAMLPLRDPSADTGRADDLDRLAAARAAAGQLAAPVAGWRLAALRDATGAPGFDALVPGASWAVEGGDVVSAAPELARLTLNLAVAHHDRARPGGGGRRLVYGGHTIGVAAAQAARVLPTLATIVAWHDCDHVGPVFEGDTLRSRLELEDREPLPDGGGLAHLRSRVHAIGADGEPRDVLDWRFVAVVA
jgi:acyl dehydratase